MSKRLPNYPDAPRTRDEQFRFLRAAHAGPREWHGLCLSLARQAPGLPAIYPSARASMEATPHARRRSLAQARRGMVAYFDDPNDSNPFAHIVTVAMWDGCDACLNPDAPDDAHEHSGELSDLLVWSNDAVRDGGVDLVRASFFPDHWGDRFQFASDWLNGYDLPGYGPHEHPTPAPDRQHIGANLDHAIADLRRAIRHHRDKGHTRIVAALVKDLAELKETRKQFP